MLKKTVSAIGAFACLMFFSCGNAAEVPGEINFQGRLTNGAAAVADGDYRMEFILHDVVEGSGVLLWSEVQDVTVETGVYSVNLGSDNPLDITVFDPGAVFLETRICPPEAAYTCDINEMETLSPRLPLTSTAFSFRAEEAENAADADKLDGFDYTDFVRKNETATIGTVMLTDDAVTSAKIGPAAVGSAALADLSVTAAKLNNEAVTTGKIADSAVTTGKIAPAAVTGSRLAGKSVGSEHLVNGAVTTYRLANGAVTADKIANGAVTAAKIGGNAVTTAKIANNAVTAAKISGGAGSGLDADLLDGQHASDIIDAASDEVRTPISICGKIITAAGSYYLTNNLNCTGVGIDIRHDDVTLDLMGFTITGNGSNYGIYIPINNLSNLEVKNGTVRNFNDGFYAPSNTNPSTIRIMEMKVLNNSRHGIDLPATNIVVQNCIVEANGGCGIRIGNYGHILNNTVYNNEEWGIYVSWSCIIRGNNILYNNTSDDEYMGGLRMYGSNYVKDNLLMKNKKKNVLVYGYDNIIEGNLLTLSSGYGLEFNNTGNFYANNRASGNSSGNYQGTSNQTDGGGNYNF